MIRCNKCELVKEEKEFQIYWHSTQQKFRTRKICRTCISIQKKEYKQMVKERKKIQPVVLELQPEVLVDYSNNPDYKLCKHCNSYKTLDCYYPSAIRNGTQMCKTCKKKKDYELRKSRVEKKLGGSDRIYMEPNKYWNEEQRTDIHNIMIRLGYIFNEEFGIWTKEGYKSIVNGKAHFTFKERTGRTRVLKVTDKMKKQIQSLFKEGYSYMEISKLLNVSTTSVYKYAEE